MSVLTLSSLLLLVITTTKFEQCLGYEDDYRDRLSETCPPCDLVDCFPSFEPADCPENTLFMPNVVWGCCPACVLPLDLDETCILDKEAEILAETEEVVCRNGPEMDPLRYFKNFPLSNIPQNSGTFDIFYYLLLEIRYGIRKN